MRNVIKQTPNSDTSAALFYL